MSDPAAAAALVPPGGGVGIRDRNYWGPDRQAELARAELLLLAPYKNKRKDPAPARSTHLTRFRRTIETVIGQLAERFRASGCGPATCGTCVTAWGGRSSGTRPAAIVLNHRAGNPPLQLGLLGARNVCGPQS